MGNLPDNNARNIYYWYYATQVMHNLPGYEWDTWNRKMRRILIESQETKQGCTAGNWDPDKPTKDAWGEPGGRIMMTSLSCLTLEVYYRYLPLYKLDGAARTTRSRTCLRPKMPRKPNQRPKRLNAGPRLWAT